MIEIKIPEDKELAAAIREALVKWSGKAVTPTEIAEAIMDTPITPEPELKPVAEPESLFDDVEEEEEEEPDDQEDVNGVLFNALYCGLKTVVRGERKGCWKAAKGVSQAAFKAWYDSQLPATEPEPEPEPTPEELARKAFASPNNPNPLLPPTSAPQVPPETPVPTNFAELCAWASEKQVGGFLKTSDINDACTALGITVADLYPPNADADIAQRTAKLFEHLQEVAANV
jgi:hypothetical protein